MTAAQSISIPARRPTRAVGPNPVPFPLSVPQLERSEGVARIAVTAAAGRSRLHTLYQAGSVKVRLPRAAATEPVEAVILNTAGGLTGGDQVDVHVSVEEGARSVATSQAAERIYRSAGGAVRIATDLAVEAGAELHWLPQETIVFDRAAVSRRLTADIAEDGTLLAVEGVVLGRAAMGETVHSLRFDDSWRIRRAGRLIFADGTRIDGDAAAILSGGATGGGATAFATILLVSPDAESRLAEARALLAETRSEAAASAWNGILVVRLVATSGMALHHDLAQLVGGLRRRPMPRVWYC